MTYSGYVFIQYLHRTGNMLPRHTSDSDPGLFSRHIVLDIDHEFLERLQVMNICE